MKRYRVMVREILAIEYEVEVAAEGQTQAYRLAQDPDEWMADNRPAIVRVEEAEGLTVEESETLDYTATDAVLVEEEEGE